MHTSRVNKVQAALRGAGLDGMVLMPGNNMIYLSGIHAHLSERPVLLFVFADEPPAVIIPSLEAMKATAAGIETTRVFDWSDQSGFAPAFAAAAAALTLNDRVLGVEAERLRLLELEALRTAAPDVTLHSADSIMATLRLRKDADEIAAIRRAVAVAESALTALLPSIQIGMTEKAIAGKLLLALLDAGADAPAFSPIVSAGPNGASPHAVPTDRPLQAGDLLVIDWGAKVGDYASDITRTVAVGAVGAVDERAQAMYAAVQAGNAAGVAASQPGASGEAIDRAARDAIEDAGWGDYFIHRTGHGLGMGEHEPPSLMAGATDPLPVGAVFTIEPGVYVPGFNGVRIEDDVWLSAEGGVSLTTLPRDLRYVG